MFKVAPGTLTPDGQKVPLMKGWREQATNDPVQISTWQQQFRERLGYWVVPTGVINDLLVLDLDVKYNGIENFRTLGLHLPTTLYQRSLNGGYHFFFKYPKNGKTYGNKSQLRFGVFDRSKPSGIDTRGEGGYVFWYGNEADFNIGIAEAPDWLLAEYDRSAAVDVTGATTNVRLDPQVAKSKFESILNTIREAPAGQSNDVLNIQAYLAGQLVASQAVSYEFAYGEIFKAAIERKGAHTSYECQETIKSGMNGGMQHPMVLQLPDVPPPLAFEIPQPEVKERWTPRFATMADLKNRSKLRQPQLFEHYSTQDIGLTTADGGTGKTTLEIYKAVMMALGERFLGFECKRPGGKTLIITGEDNSEKLYAMVGVILEQLGLFEPAPGNAEKVERVIQSILCKTEEDMCLIEKTQGGFLVPNKKAFEQIMEAVEDFKPDVIVFDPIASFWGSENALNDMARAVTKFMSKLKKQGIAVEMINHMGKTSSQTKDDSQFAGRGGTGLPSHSRVSRAMHYIGAEEYRELTGEDIADDTSAIRCTVNKFTDGSPLFNKPFLILRKGHLFTRKDLTPQKQVQELNRKTDAERVFTFVKNCRTEGKYPTAKYVIAVFKTHEEKLSEARVKEALQVLSIDGHMGEKVISSAHPDGMQTEKILIITDMDGKEV